MAKSVPGPISIGRTYPVSVDPPVALVALQSGSALSRWINSQGISPYVKYHSSNYTTRWKTLVECLSGLSCGIRTVSVVCRRVRTAVRESVSERQSVTPVACRWVNRAVVRRTRRDRDRIRGDRTRGNLDRTLPRGIRHSRASHGKITLRGIRHSRASHGRGNRDRIPRSRIRHSRATNSQASPAAGRHAGATRAVSWPA